MVVIDLSSLTDEGLSALIRDAYAEESRRRTIATAAADTERIAAAYAVAIGRETGGAWVQPTGAHDAYALGAVVTHDGHLWVSDIPANVWAPGTHGWTIDDDAEMSPAPEAEPWAEGATYAVGDLVEFEGVVYRVLQPHTSAAHWPPDAVASLYVIA